ncbi:MAG: hypothetical protein BRD25_01305 [Bacteroidetes bacterium QH_1_61_8]|nr:MAG: hypothetical protein BRD25_01305 [Bacteroidetes bacterium QH_1_61_8]
MVNSDPERIFPKSVSRFDWADVKGAFLLFWLIGAYVVLVPTLSFIPSLSPFNFEPAASPHSAFGSAAVAGNVQRSSFNR